MTLDDTIALPPFFTLFLQEDRTFHSDREKDRCAQLVTLLKYNQL